MTTNFPSSIDNFTNPTSSSTMASPSHSAQHADVNDAVEAIETALLDGAPLHIDDANERVGVGTTTPSSPLHIKADSFDMLSLDRTDNANVDQQVILTPTYSGSGNTAFAIKIGGEIMRVTEAGNVGINDTTPSYTLDVNGDINSQTDVLVSGTSLPRGLLARTATSGDATFGTSAVALMSVTFTIATSRKILLMGVVPLIDNTSSAMQVGVWLTDDNTVPLSGAWNATYNNVPSSGYSFDTTVITGRTFSTGTHTVYTMAFTTTGTARMNNAGGYRYGEMLVYDMGAG
jgi:hypothetical protein